MQVRRVYGKNPELKKFKTDVHMVGIQSIRKY